MNKYDAIVIGGGINSLATATLLSQKEKSVLLIEARDILGGMASSQEFAKGYQCNIIYDYIRWIDPRLINKLNLHKYGLEFRTPSALRIALDENGKHIFFHNETSKTAASISNHSPEDAEKWPEFNKYIRKLTHFLEPLYEMTPPVISELSMMDIFSMSTMLKPMWKHGSRGLVDTIKSIPMMMPELLDEWLESELLRGSLAAIGIANINQGPFSAATSLNFLHQHIHANGNIHNAHFIKGGTNQFAKAISLAAKENGVNIMKGTPVTSINCSNEICSGVSTLNGQHYNSDMVISGLDPQQTFIELIGSNDISPNFHRQLKNIKYRGCTARIHFSLKKRPEIIGIEKEQQDTIFAINPSMEYLERAYDDAKYGHISTNPYIEFTIPTISEPDFSPKGKHILSATVQYIPYHLKNRNWNDQLKKKVIKNVSQILEKYISGFFDIIEDSTILTSVDLQTTLGLTEGNINHGEMTLDQFFFMRPNIRTAQYRTPIQNLFLCGPGTHPGGGLHGANAVNAVQEITNTQTSI